MLTEISIQNFRILKDLRVTNLHRINLIAGSNGAGKTSLLEAAFLLTAAGHPHLFLNPNVVRGLGPNVAATLANSEGPWKEIFSNLDRSKPIEIAAQHKIHGTLKLKVEIGKPQIIEVRPGRKDISLDFGQSENSPYFKKSVTNELEIPTLKLSYVGGMNPEGKGQIQLNGGEADIIQPIEEPLISSIYLTSRTDYDQEDAIRLGRLRLRKRSDILLEALQIIEPSVQSVADSSATGLPTIFVDVGLEELVPLPVLGDGMTRFAQVVLAIASVPDGVFFVDEIENGLHHGVLPEVWKIVDKASATFNTQLIATTHSRESIVAAHDSLDSDSFRLHRLESDEGENRCVTYGPEAIGSAVEFGMEVR